MKQALPVHLRSIFTPSCPVPHPFFLEGAGVVRSLHPATFHAVCRGCTFLCLKDALGASKRVRDQRVRASAPCAIFSVVIHPFITPIASAA
jgi:hypothetical protein